MSQSEIIVGALLGGFVLFLLMSGRLATYWALLTGGGASAATPQAANAPAVTSTTPPPSGTSTANVGSFVPGSVVQIGSGAWAWKNPTTGGLILDVKPPPGYVAPTPTPTPTDQPQQPAGKSELPDNTPLPQTGG